MLKINFKKIKKYYFNIFLNIILKNNHIDSQNNSKYIISVMTQLT
jgi:hypothetical protein